MHTPAKPSVAEDASSTCTTSAGDQDFVRAGRTEPEDAYDDEQDHTKCADCKGSGYYTGFTERRLCPTCDGSGYL